MRLFRLGCAAYDEQYNGTKESEIPVFENLHLM